jgi:hypothetical protein
MIVSKGTLENLLNQSVLELAFIRRNEKQGWPPNRRMLVTNNYALLNGIFGKITLNFVPPKGVGLPYDPDAKNLVIGFDILWQAYRAIPVESTNLIAAYRVTNRQDVAKFLTLFAKEIGPMTGAQKKAYMKGQLT